MIRLTPECKQQLADVLIGTAVGDAIGLPFEGIKPKAIARLGIIDGLRHSLVGKFGMWSDDTDHSLILVRALLEANSDEDKLLKRFSRSLQLWFLGLPPGVGLGTARSVLKLFIGFSPKKSGVFTAGNGPSMRAAAIGVIYADSLELRERINTLHTQITHSDPKAAIASRAIVEVAAYLSNGGDIEDLTSFKERLILEQDECWSSMMNQLFVSLESDDSLTTYLSQIDIDPHKGVSGYSYHTVPAVLYSCFKHQMHFEKVIKELIAAGGDTDTSAAIAGALCSLSRGRATIPQHWKTQVMEWPTSLQDIEEYALQYDQGRSLNGYSIASFPLRLSRNFFQLAVVITHGLARLLPFPIKKYIY